MKRLLMLVVAMVAVLGCNQAKKPAAPAETPPSAQSAKPAPTAANDPQAQAQAQAQDEGSDTEPATAADYEDEAAMDITPDNLDQQVSQLEGEIGQ